MASHELKTPLTVIQLQGELTKRALNQSIGHVDVKALGRTSATIERNIHRITRLVDDMLDISRIATGKLNLEIETVGIRELLDESIERMEPFLAGAGCELKYFPGEETIIPVDRFRMEQVIVNLLTNAIRYGKGKPVIVSTGATSESISISVKDYGDGIDPCDHQRIFERFERATNTADKSCLGLGLFIVKIIVDLHGGFVKVNSELGQGPEFIVELPRSL